MSAGLRPSNCCEGDKVGSWGRGGGPGDKVGVLGMWSGSWGCGQDSGDVVGVLGTRLGSWGHSGDSQHIAQGQRSRAGPCKGHVLFSQKGGSLLQLRSHWQVRVSLPTMSYPGSHW